MDAKQFDTLARSLMDRRSRRGALAAVVGGALGVAGLAETDAKKKKCPPCKKRKKGKCKAKLPDGTPCGNGHTCQGGLCEVPCSADGIRYCEACQVDEDCNDAPRATCVGGLCTCTNGVICGNGHNGYGDFCVEPNALCGTDPNGRPGTCQPDQNGVQHYDQICWSWYCDRLGFCGWDQGCCTPEQTCNRDRGCVPVPPPPPVTPTCIANGETCPKTGTACCAGLVCTSNNTCMPTVATRQPCSKWEQCYYHPGSYSDLCTSNRCGQSGVCLNSEGSRCNQNCDCVQGLCCMQSSNGIKYCKVNPDLPFPGWCTSD